MQRAHQQKFKISKRKALLTATIVPTVSCVVARAETASVMNHDRAQVVNKTRVGRSLRDYESLVGDIERNERETHRVFVPAVRLHVELGGKVDRHSDLFAVVSPAPSKPF